MKINKYSRVNKNTALFDQYAREIVAGMLLYNSITMQYKSLYLDGVKSEIFKYEGLYHQAAHRNIVEKLKKVKVVSFQTIEEIFKIEFQKNSQIQIDEKEKTIEQIFSEHNEKDKLESVENWLRIIPRRKLPRCFLDWVRKQPEEEKARLRNFIKREK
jgi:hypothetical protein